MTQGAKPKEQVFGVPGPFLLVQGAKPKEQVLGLVVHKSQRQKQKEIKINKRMGKMCYTFSVVTADGKK